MELFEITSGVYGRHMRARKDIFPRDIIINGEASCLVCPKVLNACIECLDITNDSCPACGFFLCKACQIKDPEQRIRHDQEECLILLRGRGSKDSLSSLGHFILYVLRAWRHLQTSRALHFLLSHAEKISPRHHVWATLHRKLKDTYCLPIKKGTLATILGIRRVNAKSLGNDRGFGIYSNFSLINHSCRSNAYPTIDEKSFRLYLKAATFIPKGTEINITYGPCSESLHQPLRRDTLFRHWDFICSCPACLEPQASSAIPCLQCRV
ncbi:Protein msta_ isoform Blike, partial [Caligus rogercresseyi]